jgi:hypothetical protein
MGDRDDPAQISGSGLLHGNGRNAFLLELIAELIEALIDLCHLPGKLQVTRAEGLHRAFDLLVDLAAEAEQIAQQAKQIAIEGGSG